MSSQQQKSIQTIIQNLQQIAQDLNKYSDDDLVMNALSITPQVYQEKILKYKGIGSKKICSAPIPKGTLYFKCFECSKEMTHVYCQACFKREKHVDHVVTYHYSNGGCCDCGDTLIMNTKSFCSKHQSKIVQIHNPEKDLGYEFIKQYEQFIMISFGLLFNMIEEIVDHPYNFLNVIQSLQRDINDPEIQQQISQNLNRFINCKKIVDSVLLLYDMIFRVLRILTSNNILISYLTSQCLQKPIDLKIQESLPLKHSHFSLEYTNYLKSQFFQRPITDTQQQRMISDSHIDNYAKFELLPNNQNCNCSILENYVKYNQFLSGLKKEELQDMSEIFYELHVDDNFKLFLCKLIIQNFQNLYKPYKTYKIVSNNGRIEKIKINSKTYSSSNIEKNLFLKFTQDAYSKYKTSKNGIHQAGIFCYFYQFMGHIVITLLQLYKETKSIRSYHVFDVNSQNLLQIPLCNNSSQTIVSKFDDMIVQQFYDETVKLLFTQISDLLGLENSKFSTLPIDLKFPQFNYLQHHSLLIYALTRTYPCSQTELDVFYFSNKNEGSKLISSQMIQVSILNSYRNLLRVVVETWRDTHKQFNYGMSNIYKLIINYFLNNFINSFQINNTSSKVHQLLKNQVIGDRNFISVLAAYLIEFKDPQDAYENLLEISGHQAGQFHEIMLHLLKRTILSYIVMGNFGNIEFYAGRIKLYKENARQSEVALEQVDITYMQIYAFLFGADGINEIIQTYEDISNLYQTKLQTTYLICRIALTDYDYCQTVAFTFDDQIPEQFQRTLSKLFQTIFFAYSFLSQEELVSILKKFSVESRMDLQQVILSSCQLNYDNDQLQLKKNLQPALYEPIFAKQIPDLRDFINNKLQNQGDYFTELFGNSLEFELAQMANPKSTLTYKRFAILKALSMDKQQILLSQIVEQLNQEFQNNNTKAVSKILEDNSIIIGLLAITNKLLQSDNDVLVKNLKKILNICLQIIQKANEQNNIYNAYVQLLDAQAIFMTQENDAQLQMRTQIKKKQLKSKFEKMSQSLLKQCENLSIIDNQVTVCSQCQIPFSYEQSQYRAILIQQTNQHQYLEHQQQIKNYPQFSYQISACPHLFHLKCLVDNTKKYYINDQQFLKCSICSQPYNYPILNSNNFQNIEDEKLREDFNFYLQTLDAKDVEYYYTKFSKDNNLCMPSIYNDLFIQSLCNLLYQLLCDIKMFIQKEYHQILQSIIKILQLTYQNGQNSLLTIFQADDSIVIKFIYLVDYFIIQRNEIEQFKIAIKQSFNNMFDLEFLAKIFTEKQIAIENQQIVSPIDINQYKTQLQAQFVKKFKQNYKEFLITYLLSPCQKKKCNNLKLPEFQSQKGNFELQFLCLVCLKKMCFFCKKNQKCNLTRHSNKKHKGKSMYLNIHTGEIITMTGSYYTLSKNVLFKNLIGEQPALKYQKNEFYEKYGLNLKAIDEILDVLLGEKYLQKIFMNVQKVLRLQD